jgi:hypothetical protein
MDLRIAVALRGGGVEIACAIFAGEIESIDGSGGADEEGLDAKTGVVDGACRRGKVEEEIDFTRIEGFSDVAFEKAKPAFVFEVGEVGEVSSAEIIHADYRVASSKQSVTKMGAEKTGCSCDENGSRHHLQPFFF